MKTKTIKVICFSLVATIVVAILFFGYLRHRILLQCEAMPLTACEHLQGEEVIASSKCTYMIFAPHVRYDEQTQKTTIIWGNEYDWDNQSSPLWFENVRSVEVETLPEAPDSAARKGLIGISWSITNEGEHTILHCYMKVPSGELKNLWLASEETAIVDLTTGVNYRAIHTIPDCMNRNFGVKTRSDALLDFQVVFPKLPETTTDIAIYGVPVWHMRGMKAKIKRADKSASEHYDKTPKFRIPQLMQTEGDYNKNDGSTWAVYSEPHLIKPAEEGTMALWRTPEATYLAYAHEQNWMREYFGIHPSIVLIDEFGQKYTLRETLGLPSDNHIFWMDGYSGDHMAFVYVFEPLSAKATTVSFIEPDGEPFEAWGANWEGQTIVNLDIEKLRQNQPLFEYHKRKIVIK